MSNALAIAAVTSVMRDRIQAALSAHSTEFLLVLGGVPKVTAIAPDLVITDNNPAPSLNLYFYGATPNQGWRNVGLPSYGGDGDRLANRPLALDLHYLLTAYGSSDLQAEVLLGYAMQHLHEAPVLDRDTVRETLALLPVGEQELMASHLADQIELVKITPETMSTEEISKLWTAFSASYRPSAAYRATVVLIEADEPVRTPLPVLTRGPADSGPIVVTGLMPPYPTLTAICPPGDQPSARLGDRVQLLGHHLDGTDHEVVFTHFLRASPIKITPAAGDITADEITVAIPDDVVAEAEWPAGLWAVHVDVTQDGTMRTTNTLPIALAPTIPVDLVVSGLVDIDIAVVGNTTTFTVTVKPKVWPEQSAALVVGQQEVVAQEDSWPSNVAGELQPTDTLTFEMEDVAAATSPYVRLRVDGVESHLIDRTKSPPEFDETQKVAVP